MTQVIARKVFHPSVEGAQHGPKGLRGFLRFAALAGAKGAQPTSYMLEKPDGGFLSAAEIRREFENPQAFENSPPLRIDGVSVHCIDWVHGTAWTGSKTIRPFLPPHVARLSVEKIEQWCEDYLLRLMDLVAELGVHVMPMFWGTLYGWEAATGYPWGFWAHQGSPGNEDLSYDLLAEGDERFVRKTARLREHARQRKIKKAHEVHSGTAAQCARDFLRLVRICDNDPCLAVNADPTHCWDGETWQTRFALLEALVAGCHMKNHIIRPGFPLRGMEPDWRHRGMQFTQLDRGAVDQIGYAELMLQVGYAQRYCQDHGTETAPLVVEAEGAYADLDEISTAGIRYVGERCCFTVAGGSFEAGIGAQT